MTEADLADAVAEAAAEFDAEEGTLAVARPAEPARRGDRRRRCPAPGHVGGPDRRARRPAAGGRKGLEFDSVLVVDPAGIVAEGVRGHNDLYVALTRATQRLGVVHPGDLPPELAGLEVRAAP